VDEWRQPLTRLACARHPLPASRGEGRRRPLRTSHLHLSNSQRSAARSRGDGCPASLFRSPKKKMRGAERRQALVRNAAPGGPSRERTHLRIAGDDRPMTRAGAPLGALLRRSPYGVGPRFRRRQAPPSAGSRQEAIVPPGGAPTPPGCVAANHARGRRTRRGGELPRAVRRSREAHLRSALRPAPPSRRLMMAPLGEQGARRISPVLRAGITYFRKLIPPARLTAWSPVQEHSGRHRRPRSARSGD
jgi:hypothetical protein